MLSDLIRPENILLGLESTEKDMLFAEMLEVLIRAQPSISREEAEAALLKREEQASTRVMRGIAVPHANCPSAKRTAAALGISYSGIDYDADSASRDESSGDPLVHIVIMILFEQGNSEEHLHILADCARVLSSPDFYKSVLAARTVQEVHDLIREYELGM